MKHYFSFLVLSLFVFLSLVCPSPVMAQCTNTLNLDISSDRVIPTSCPTGAPSGLHWNHNYYGVGEDDYFWDWKGTKGELYYKITLNGATTCTFSISLANSENAWMNIYSAGTGSDQCVVGGETYHKSSYHGLNGHNYSGSFNTETVSSVSLSEGTYIISIYGQNNTSMQSISITASDNVFCESSCTAPDHVDISGNWDYFGGETISLSAQAYSSSGTGSPIDEEDITGYQWKHNGSDIDGATSKTFTKTNCTSADGGDYSCVVSTGAACSTESSPFGTKVYVLQCYTGGETTYNFTRVGTDKVGTVEVPLNSGPKEFKIYAGASQYYGNNTSAVYSDISNYEFNGNEGNFHLEAGLGGTFTFTIDYTDNGGAPKVSVTYPRKTIYLTPGVWDKDDAKFAIYYFISNDVNGWTDFMTANDCGMSAEIPLWNGVKMIAARINGSLNAPAFGEGKCYNKTNDITVESSKDYISITGWDNSDYTYGTFSPTTYTISFAGNGNSGGSMSNVTAIPCGEDRTLVANGFTKTGHSFTNWIANADVKINGETVTAGSSISNEATIQDITQNITLTAQWSVNEYTLTWDLAGGTVATAGTAADKDATGTPSDDVEYGTPLTAPVVTKTGYNFSAWSPAVASTMPAANTTYTATWTIKTTTITIDANTTYHGSTTPGTVTATWGSALPSFTAASGVAGYGLIGYYTGATDGTKIINADGTLVRNTTYATDEDTPKWKYEGGSVTLYPQYDLIICQSSRTYQVEDILIAAGSVTCKDAQADGANTLVVNSTTNTSSSHYSDYMNNGSGPYGGGYVMNTAASKTIYMEVDIPSAGSYDIALWYGKNNGSDKVEWLNIYTRTFTTYTSLTYGGNTYYKLENDGYRVSSTASSSYYISTTPYEKPNLSLPPGKIVIGIWSEYANAVYDQIRITHHDDSDVFCKHDITVNTTTGASADATASVSKALSGTTVTVTAAAASAGYAFTGWTVTSGSATFADASALSTTFVMPDADVTVQANYASSGYVVNYEVVGGNGTITSVKDGSGNDISSGDAVASGTVLTFTASPSSGYAVLGWYTYLNSTETLQGNTQNSSTFNYEVTGAITIRVKFDTPYTLTLNSSPAAASATVSGGGSYVQGTVVSVSTSNENGDYTFVHWMDGESEVSTSAASNYVMPASNKTLTAVWRLSRISSLSWAGSEDLGSGMEIASSCFDGGCFDTDVTFTFMGDGTVNYYDNNDRETLLGTITNGTAITLNDNLRARGIYIRCTSGSATLTGVSKTTVGSVYTIWSGSVVVSANYTGVNEAGEEVTLSAEDQNWWLQQVVLGPEHFQTAAVGDTLRVTYTNIENGDAKGAIQTATKYNAIPGNIYNESDGSTVSSDTHEFNLPSSGYYHIITAGSLDSLKNKGIVVKGKGHTITRVSLHASCSNLSLRTTAPDVRIHGADGSIDIMTNKLEFEGEGFNLGNWEHKLELDERCFNSVTVGSIINFYMKVEDGATLSFRCNVPSIIADDKQDGEGCPSYGDISFDRTIDDLYGDAPTLIGRIKGYKVLYLLVDADMLRRLKETGMILCGKGTLIKVVEGVPETVVVNPGEEKNVPTVVNNLTIHQGGEVTNESDIEVLGNITYIRPAHDDGQDGKLGNQLDTWYTFTLPFTVNDVEVRDEGDGNWYDINAVYYSSDDKDQDTYAPDGAGHYYLQYLSKEEIASDREEFINRWQYITPGHSLACVSEYVANDGTRYGYPKKNEAYIILFDRVEPIGSYFQTNTEIRFVGRGPQTIEGVAKQWKVTSDGDEYWMYANNTLHSFTLDGDAYILNDEGTYFILQSNPTIRPFECYVQATESLKTRYAALPMRGFHIDNTPTGMESMQGSAIRAEKILRNGQLIIIRNGVEYDATGAVIR